MRKRKEEEEEEEEEEGEEEDEEEGKKGAKERNNRLRAQSQQVGERISEEYNAKRGSDPSKTADFRIDVSLIVHVFSEPLLESIFGGSRCRPMLNSAILSAFCDPR